MYAYIIVCVNSKFNGTLVVHITLPSIQYIEMLENVE